jgi:glycosyltransferase involved in cell wall biosynthesis
MKLHIIVPTLPPQLDGIGDYTAALAAQLAPRADVTLLTGDAFETTPIDGVRIVPAFRPMMPVSAARLAACVRADPPDWLLLQYNPFSYGRRGLNLHLPRALRTLRRTLPRTRLAVMAHEVFVPIIDVKFAVMATWQRAQLGQLGRAADGLFFSIQPWVRQFARWFPGKPILHLPVGSNIPRVAVSRQEARAELGFTDEDFVVGLFGTAHVSRMLPLINDTLRALTRAGHRVTLLYVGPNADIVRAHVSAVPVLTEGVLPGAAVSRRFAAMDMYLAPFLDGVSTRRTSLMAALQHGVATVGSRGVWSDPLLLQEDENALLLADVKDESAFRQQALRLAGDAALRARLGTGAAQLFAREFAWESIADRLLCALEEWE